MSDRSLRGEQRLLELLADRAVFGLSARQRERLGRLAAAHPEFDLECLDRVAAAVDLAVGPGRFPPLPAALRDRARAEAARHLPGGGPTTSGPS
jgi:hypothetical protein